MTRTDQTTADRTEGCLAFQKRNERRTGKTRDRLAGVCLLTLLAGLAGCSYSPEGDARWQARKAVKAKLTSPGSAKLVNDAVVAHTQDNAYYLVYVVMDSHNKFGAMMRTHHLALMQTNGPDKSAEAVTVKSYENSPSVSEAKEFQFMGTGWINAAPAR